MPRRYRRFNGNTDLFFQIYYMTLPMAQPSPFLSLPRHGTSRNVSDKATQVGQKPAIEQFACPAPRTSTVGTLFPASGKSKVLYHQRLYKTHYWRVQFSYFSNLETAKPRNIEFHGAKKFLLLRADFGYCQYR